MRVWAVAAVAFLQVFLFVSHWFLYRTLVAFWPPFLPLTAEGSIYLRNLLFVLSASFIVAALLGFRFANGFVAFLYKLASIWLGVLNFLFWAAWLCWLAALLLRHREKGNFEALPKWAFWLLGGWLGFSLLGEWLGRLNPRLAEYTLLLPIVTTTVGLLSARK